MLRTTIQRNDNIDITYPEVTSLLKKSAVGFVQQRLKSNVFQPNDLQRFFNEAKDIEFLAVKVSDTRNVITNVKMYLYDFVGHDDLYDLWCNPYRRFNKS